MAGHAKQVVSANDLLEGDVVYLGPDGTWTKTLHEAAVADSDEAAAALLSIANSQPERVVGPYLVAVRQDADVVLPVHIREQLRVAGPSILPVNGRTAR